MVGTDESRDPLCGGKLSFVGIRLLYGLMQEATEGTRRFSLEQRRLRGDLI